MGFVEQIVSPVISTYAKGDRLTNQSAIQCLCGFTAFHSHVSRIWLRNYSLMKAGCSIRAAVLPWKV